MLGALLGRVREAAFALPERLDAFDVGARAVTWAVLLLLAWSYVFAELDRAQLAPSMIHGLLGRVNLVFHEGGHIVFAVLGSFMATLGGSLMQILMPLICAWTFLFRYANAFGASVALWWTGQRLVELAPYIADARAQKLILLGGVTGRDVPGYHDWNNLLGRLGWLAYDRALGRLTHLLGAALLVLALVWGIRLLLQQRRALRQSAV